MEDHNQPSIVLIPFSLFGERLFRVCRFVRFQGYFAQCVDTGLIRGKRNIYAEMKRFGKEYSYPADHAVFSFDGVRI